jgi:hypothetical protein
MKKLSKEKPLKIFLPETIKNTLITHAKKHFRTLEDEIIFILSETLGKTPDRQIEDAIALFDKLVEHNNKTVRKKFNKQNSTE